jgi:hypothetical protein
MILTGVACVILAAIGAVLPGLPTTIFLIAAVYLLARSHPGLERRLIRNRFFARFLPYVYGNERLSARARLGVIGVMWVSVAFSCFGLTYAGIAGPWILSLIVGLAVLGAAVVWWR